MFRLRMAGALAVVVLLAAACGDDGGEAVTGDRTQDAAEATSTAQAGPDDVSDGGGPAEEDMVRPSGSGDDAAEGSESGDGASTSEDGEAAVPMDAGALLASATTTLEGRSVRGEASIEFAPGFGVSSIFDADADGDIAATIEVPPGFDPEFPSGTDAEFRYVDGVMYVRPAVPDETLAELGVDEAWYVAESMAADDPTAATVLGGAGGVLCIFPQAIDEPVDGCDPLGETGVFLEAAREAEIVGREDVRGTETTRVRFQVSLMDLAGDTFGRAPGADDAESPDGAFFDESSSDPFAEGMEEFFALLDIGFDVEVWIDDDNLIRRLAFDLASMFAGLAGGDAGADMPSNVVTLEFYDFDADISVDAPPPEAIVDEDLLVGGDDYATSEEYEPYDDE